MRITASRPCSIAISEWSAAGRAWSLSGSKGKVRVEVAGLEAGAEYLLEVRGEEVRRLVADGDGVVRFDVRGGKGARFRLYR
jgi:hypothetical protein